MTEDQTVTRYTNPGHKLHPKVKVDFLLLFHESLGYCYLGIDLTSDCGWDTHVKRVISNGRKKANQLHSNRNINLSA